MAILTRMPIPPPPLPALIALHQAIDEGLLTITGQLCDLHSDEKAIEEAILPPEFTAARREADAQRQAWKEQWKTVIAPVLVGAGMDPKRIEELRRDIMRAIDEVSEERTWAQAERGHV